LPSDQIHIDFAFPEAMLAIEVDGYAWHMDRPAFECDRERDNELRHIAWTVYRFTWAMIRFHGARVIELIRTHLQLAGCLPARRPRVAS
jgi:very-short-patch-repair endonuclease